MLKRLFIFLLFLGTLTICFRYKPATSEKSETTEITETTKITEAQVTGLLRNILQHPIDSEENIFFIETSGSVNKSKLASINSRQACSIESAALTNPNANVFLIFSEKTQMKDLKIFDALKQYKNIFFLRLDLAEFANGTVVEKLVSSGKVYDSSYLRETMSDVLRLLLLWR